MITTSSGSCVDHWAQTTKSGRHGYTVPVHDKKLFFSLETVKKGAIHENKTHQKSDFPGGNGSQYSFPLLSNLLARIQSSIQNSIQ